MQVSNPAPLDNFKAVLIFYKKGATWQMRAIFGLSWFDVLKISDTAQILYQTKIYVKPVAISQVRGFPCGFV